MQSQLFQSAPQQAAKLQKLDATDVRTAYRRWAPFYDATFGKFADAGVRQAAERANTLSGRLLEVGVGTGLALPHYLPALRVTGVDLSPHMLMRARDRADKCNAQNVEALIEMDATALAFAPATFDIAVATYVMTVVPEPARVMHELARVVRPGGQIIIVSHFCGSNGVMGAIEKRMARHAATLGWRPNFSESTIMVSQNLRLIHREKVRPFGFFTLLQFEKTV
jgi:phosphatidylethanolamine/phosphatidyl-N-methylethanolamine N-methyltransferase